MCDYIYQNPKHNEYFWITLDWETNGFARNCCHWNLQDIIDINNILLYLKEYKSCKHLTKDSHSCVKEITETTWHIALSQGPFIKELWEVSFLEQPAVTPQFMLVRYLPSEFCFQYLCCEQATVYLRAWEAAHVLQNQCAIAVLLPMETGFLGRRKLWKGWE